MFPNPRVKELFNLISGKKQMKKSKMNKTSLRLTISNIHSGLFSKTILLVSIFLGEVLFLIFPITKEMLPLDTKWTHIRHLEGVLDVFWKSYVRSIYALYPGSFLF